MSENADSGDAVPLTELDGLRTANASLERVNRRQFDMLQALFCTARPPFLCKVSKMAGLWMSISNGSG